MSDSSSPSLPRGNGASQRHRDSRWVNLVKNFTAAWFPISMNTGIIGILTYHIPTEFEGQQTLACILYVFNILLFTTFIVITSIRWIVYRRDAIEKTAGNVDEISMLGTPAIAFLTLVGLTASIPTNFEWGGHGFTLLAVAMFWIGTAWILLSCFGLFITFFKYHVFDDRSSSPAMMLPMVGTATNGVVGAVVARFAYNISPGLAVPIIIVSYMLLGIGFLAGTMLYTIYFHRLLAVGFPPGAKSPSLFMLVGPYGQSAAGLILLGNAASMGNFQHYNKGTFLTSESGSTIASAGIMIALLCLGMDMFWLAISIWGVLEAAYKREHQYSLAWWALIFPKATVTTTFLVLSEALDSDAFRGLAAAFLIILVVEYVFNWAFTIWYSIRGNLLIKPEKKDD